MKKIAFAAIMLAALFATASCQKEQNSPERKASDPMVINAVAEGVGIPTKTEMAYKYDVLWSENDKIHVTDGNSADTFTLSAGAGTTRGTFTQDGTASLVGEVEAYYPASMVDGNSLVWPATQTNNQTVPMYSSKTVTGTTEDFSFSSLGAVLQLAISTSAVDKTLSRIEIYDAEKSLSGTFTVTDGKAIIASEEKNSIVFDAGETPIGIAAKYFNIAVPAGKYNNLTLKFFTSDGQKTILTSTSMPEIQHNTVAKVTLAVNQFKQMDLDKSEMNLYAGGRHKLVPIFTPEAFGEQEFVWSSSDETVATVNESGMVDAVAAGTATITVQTKDGEYTSTCAVTVLEKLPCVLPGVFSVGDNKFVFFTSTNMSSSWDPSQEFYNYCQINDDEQYAYPSDGYVYWLENDDNLNNVIEMNETKDTPSPEFKCVYIDGIYQPKAQGKFRVLSDEECAYLLGDNDQRKDMYRYGVTVKGKAGCLILYPDGYTGAKVENGDTSTYDTGRAWRDAEDAGVVCLPAAGYRGNVETHDSDSHGYYWLSTSVDSDGAYYLYSSMDKAPRIGYDNRRNRYSIRLVMNVEE